MSTDLRRVHRIEVRSRSGAPDPRGAAACRDAQAAGVSPPPERIDYASVYLIDGALETAQLERVAVELLANPVTEEAIIGVAPPRGDALIEVHPLPGVTDPDAEAVALAIRTTLDVEVDVRTGRRFDFHGTGESAAQQIVERSFANPVVHDIHRSAYHPASFPSGVERPAEIVEVPLEGLDDATLARMSREAHLFLSLEEMQTIQAAYRHLGRAPREIELETFAQTWSEHCVHKTFKATIRYRGELPGFAPGPDGTITIDNLFKTTIVAATRELMSDGLGDWCLSVFDDNAGVVAFDDEHAVCFKVETHNHPSAIEPYGGAATGIGGCIRDIIGTGLAAKPIAATDVFCVAWPGRWVRPNGDSHGDAGTRALPIGCLQPERVLRQVVAGVRDYGNRMGIPTLSGAVWFDDDYVGNPLVYCGCVGVMPRTAVHGAAEVGDRIIAVGGRTGRDGIHGATFSSSELTDAHADEFGHAVQIGNPVIEKKMLDAILLARDAAGGCLYSAITDCGAGGFSSAIGEMGAAIGATVDLERAPLKYHGLTPTEVWISEAQERMVMAVPGENVDALRAICDQHDVELCDLGSFGAGGGAGGAELILRHDGAEFGRMSMEFLHDGLPGTAREATWTTPESNASDAAAPPLHVPIGEALTGLLAHPNIASKHWVIRQYDHEVQGRSVIKPLVGASGAGPGDAAVVLPVAGSSRGLAIAQGLATGLRDDPYLMGLAAIDECVRNLVCVGADPDRIAVLDNFCWPSCDDPAVLGSLVRAAVACRDGSLAYRVPFISGKDSLNNQFQTEDGTTIQIPPTLLISGFGIVPDVARCVTMDLKTPGNLLLIVGTTGRAMGGSHYAMQYGGSPVSGTGALPCVDLLQGPRTARVVHAIARRGLACAIHDCSEGGLVVAAVEMAIAGDLGLALDLAALPRAGELSPAGECFAETPSRDLVGVRRADLDAVDALLGDTRHAIIGEVDDTRRLALTADDTELDVAELRDAWSGTLDW